MYVRKEDGVNRVIGLMENEGRYAPVIFKVKQIADEGYVVPVRSEDLTVLEKEDFYNLVINTKLSRIPLKHDSEGNRIIIATQLKEDDNMYPAFVSEEGSPVLVNVNILNDEELFKYSKLLKENGMELSI